MHIGETIEGACQIISVVIVGCGIGLMCAFAVLFIASPL